MFSHTILHDPDEVTPASEREKWKHFGDRRSRNNVAKTGEEIMMENQTFLDALKETFGSNVKTGVEADKAAHEALFNRGCSKKPCAIVECTQTQDVQAAVRLATKYSIPLSVLGGGSHWAGFAIAQDGLMLDLRTMTQVRVNREKPSVTFGGGSRVNDVLQSLPEDLVSVTGAVSSVGYTGLTLGGGYGPLNSRFGLACDTVLSAELVLADGSVVVADANSNADLLWALRGGGGSYGVVTALELELYRVPEVQTAIVALPLDSAARMLGFVQKIVEQAPDELSVLSGLVTLPHGHKGMFLQPCLSERTELGEKLFEELCSQTGTQVIMRSWVPYRETFDREAEKAWYAHRNYRVSNRLSEALSAEIVDTVLRNAERAPTPGCAILLHDFHGKASLIPLDSAAYPLRKVHYVVEVIAGWDSEADGVKANEWLDQILQDLEPNVLAGAWANVLGPEEKRRANDFYEPSQERLRAVKKKFDPQNVFFSNVAQP
jgi:FAD/FMN-containing dehydrogenase